MKTYITILLLLNLKAAYALEAKWLGVAGVMLKDDQTTLLIDPVFTKPTISHWLFNAQFQANPEKAKAALLKNEISKVDGIFISHCHFDHASDVAFLSSHLKAPVYGGESLRKIVHHFDAKSPFNLMGDKSEVQIGQFKIKMFHRPHPAIIRSIDWHFLGGKISEFKGNFYDYREGEVWMFIIEHPEGITIFDQSSVFFEESRKYAGKVDNLFLGVANAENKQTHMENNIQILEPKRVISIHHEFFFLESERLSSWVLPTVDFNNIESGINRLNLKTRLIIPVKDEWIKLNPE